MTESNNGWETSVASYLDVEQGDASAEAMSTGSDQSATDDFQPALAPSPAPAREAMPAASSAPWQQMPRPSACDGRVDSEPDVRGDTVWQRLRVHARALVTADAEPEALLSAAESIQRVVPTGRRLVVLGAHPRAGATTIAASTALIAASFRHDVTAAVEGFFDERALAKRIGAGSELTSADIGEVLAIRAMGGNAAALAPVSMSVPLSVATFPGRGDPSIASFVQWLCRTRAIIVTDAKVDGDMQLIHDAHAVVICHEDAEEGRAAANRLSERLAAVGIDENQVVPVSVSASPPERRFEVRPRSHRRSADDISARIPFDAHLAQSCRIDLDRVGYRTRLALIHLTARLLDVSLAGFPAGRDHHGRGVR